MVEVTHTIPRAELGFNRSDKMNLTKVEFDDIIVTNAIKEISDIIDNCCAIVNIIPSTIYQNFLYLTKENTVIEDFVKDDNSIKDYNKLINK